MDCFKEISEMMQNCNCGEMQVYTEVIAGVKYKCFYCAPDPQHGINIPSIVAVPLTDDFNNQIILESNNKEINKKEGTFDDILSSGIKTGVNLAKLTNNKPGIITIPLIPGENNELLISEEKKDPYFQQLSKECFNRKYLEEHGLEKYYRIDEQVVRIINKAKIIAEEEKGMPMEEKIFLNGYSSSGVFAQRFSLLHPEIIDTVCIGGASGSIPIPTDQFPYPLGTSDIEKLTGKKFDMAQYFNICFRYFVGELETLRKTNERFDDNGAPAPMHDMSYYDRSVPTETGKEYRQKYGTDLITRAKSIVNVLKSEKIDMNIEHTIIEGRSHNDQCGHGVNECGDKFVNDTYNQSIERRNKQINKNESKSTS